MKAVTVTWICMFRKSVLLLMILMVITLGWSRLARAEMVHPMLVSATPVMVTLGSEANDPIIASFEMTAKFGAPVTGLTASQLQTVNATISSFTSFSAPSLAAGDNHSLVVCPDGTVAAWGYNGAGQCTIPAGLNRVWTVAVGFAHSLALKTDGTVVAWGDNSKGQCTVPPGLGGVVAIAGGKSHSLALKADGTVVAWGDNSKGQCTPPAGLTHVVAIAAGDEHSVALKTDGTVVIWGITFSGSGNIPQPVGRFKAIAAGYGHTVAVQTDGTVAAWGFKNFYGNLNVPSGLNNVIAISARGNHNLALKADGTVVAWGDGSTGACNVPTNLGGVTGIAAGAYHNLALKADGTMVAFGSNQLGQCNIPAGVTGQQAGIFGCSFDVQPIAPGVVSVQVPAGATTSLDGQPNQASNLLTRNYVLPGSLRVAIQPPAAVTAGAKWRRRGTSTWRDAGTTEGMLPPGNYPVEFNDLPLGAWKMPANQVATVSAGTTTTLTAVYETLPVTATLTRFIINDPATNTLKVVAEFGKPVTGLTSASLKTTNAVASHLRGMTIEASMAIDGSHCLAIRPDGTVVDWWMNMDNAYTVRTDLKGVVALSARGEHFMALRGDGTVAAWGKNNAGQCNVPTPLAGVVAIAAGGSHSLALKADGTVAAWGKNDEGQCNVPAGLSGVMAIAAGDNHNLALKADGSVVAWGANYSNSCEIPAELNQVVAISAGPNYSVALKSDGTIVTWGNDLNGQCRVPSGLADVVAISAGPYHVMAQRADGTLIAWGGISQTYPYGPTGVTTIPAGLGKVTAFAAGDYGNLALQDNGTLAVFPDNISSPNYAPTGLVVLKPAFLRACFDLTPQAPGLTTVQVPAGVVRGPGDVPNQASNTLDYEFLPPGEFKVNLGPEAAVAQSAQWRRVGGTHWLDSGSTQTYYFPGTYSMEFKAIDLTGWRRPPVTNASIPSGTKTTLDAQYEAVPVTVTLTSDASGPMLTSMTVQADFSHPVSSFNNGKLTFSNAHASNMRGGAALPSLAIGGSHCLSLASDGTIRAWGENTYGLANVPAGLHDVIAVACGTNHNLALKIDGTVVTWGANDKYQLRVPTGLSHVVGIAAGTNHSLALNRVLKKAFFPKNLSGNFIAGG